MRAKTLALALCAVAADATPLLTLWPSAVDATLDFQTLQDTWFVESSHGQVLASVAMESNVELPEPLHAAIQSVEVTWTPFSTTPSSPSSTFDRVFGASLGDAPGIYATGVHLRVVLQDTSLEELVDEHESIESSIRILLRTAWPNTAASFLEMQHDSFLTIAPCSMAKHVEAATAFASPRCLSSSFTSRELATDNKALFALEVELGIPRVVADASTRMMIASFSLSSTTSASVDVKYLTVSASEFSRLVGDSVEADGAFQKAIVKTVDIDTQTLEIISSSDVSAGQRSLPSTATVTGLHVDANVSIVGEGFHQHVEIQLEPTSWPTMQCGENGVSVLVPMPLSSSVYTDLDELRRMERFGELSLHAVTKHIEIERPSAVSAQHVVGLEYKWPNASTPFSVSFPIHFRYQSPSEGEFYAPASVIAPDFWFQCVNADGTERVDEEPHDKSIDDSFEAFFSQWLRHSARHWHRVIPSTPLAIDDVLIPVGFKPHGSVVSMFTIGVTSLGAILLVYIAITTAKSSKDKSE
ncbi:hypothetical protein Poli38472_008573 [Pythium oligandrum]|uniref:GPI transamidase component PIG-T n=1 Tax=Pythium oligandrum TaxID=41045 RepID=A0A8K1C3V1_PYTOL|nr:hypothetical protein Poli38472_008573 [Pythium oligandrum]|eukprot:TMW55925.1 hypothetical protein Poli38472_008573 [Pythium oligandrum]